MRTAFHRNLAAQAAETRSLAERTGRAARQARRLADLPGNALLLVLDARRVVAEAPEGYPPTHGDLNEKFGQRAAKALGLDEEEIDFLLQQIFPLGRKPDPQEHQERVPHRGPRGRSARQA